MRSDAQCAICGLHAGNGAGIRVMRHILQRNVWRDGRSISVKVGSLGLCDACIREYARPPRRLRIDARKLGYRS